MCQLSSFIVNVPECKLLFCSKNVKWKYITIKVRKEVRSVGAKNIKSRFADIGSCPRSLMISSIRLNRNKRGMRIGTAIRSQPGFLNKNNICIAISIVKECGQYFIGLCTIVLNNMDWCAFHKEWTGLSVVGSSGFLIKFL